MTTTATLTRHAARIDLTGPAVSSVSSGGITVVGKGRVVTP